MGLNCKNCKQRCCEGYLSARNVNNEMVILLPLSKKEITIDKIPLIRVTDRLWRCKHFDKKTGKCLNYYNRPPLCKFWYCPSHEIYKNKEKLEKLRAKIPVVYGDNSFVLTFTKKMIGARI